MVLDGILGAPSTRELLRGLLVELNVLRRSAGTACKCFAEKSDGLGANNPVFGIVDFSFPKAKSLRWMRSVS